MTPLSARLAAAATSLAGILALTGSAATAGPDLPELPIIGGSTTTTTAAPPPGERVYFNRAADGNVDLWRVDPATISAADPDGDAAPVAGANSPAWDFNADVTRDGRTLAFVSARDGDDEIFLLDLVTPGAEPVQLTHNTTSDRGPAWSPDGSSIAFVGVVPIGRRDVAGRVRVMTRDGSVLRTVRDREPHDHTNPAWSPDGTRLAFGAGYAQRSSLYVVDATADDAPHPLTSGTRQEIDRDPDWSPDGTQIAFARGHWSGAGVRNGLLVVSASGGTPRALVAGEGVNASQPAWHPSGRTLLFSGGDRGAPNQIHRLDVAADGTAGTPTPLLSPAGFDTQPEWAVAAR